MNNSWGKAKLLATALVTILSSHGLAKSQIISDFELLLPRQFQQTLIDQKWQSLAREEFTGKWQIPDQDVLAQGVPVKINDIFLNIRSHLAKPALNDSEAALKLTAKDLAATLTVGNITVDHFIEQEMGGILGRFRVQAVCRNVVLQLTPGEGHFALSLAPQVGVGEAKAHLQEVELNWRPGSWTIVGSMQCEGAKGFEELLKDEIARLANDSETFIKPQLPHIRHLVQEYLENVKLDFSGTRQLIVSRPDLKVTLSVDDFIDLGSVGVKASGKIQIDFLRDKEGSVKHLTLATTGKQNPVQNAQLRLPKDFAQEVLAKAYSANSWLHSIFSNDISGFASLMNSRFIQWFVWPELMKYSKKSVFRFDLYSDKDIKISGGGMSYQVDGRMYARMMAPKENKYINFMHFTMPINSRVNLSVADGKASATFVKPKMSLQAGWYASYLERGRVSKGFSTRTILGRIVDSVAGQTVSMDIPQLQIAEGVSLKVKGVSAVAGQDIFLQLVP